MIKSSGDELNTLATRIGKVVGEATPDDVGFALFFFNYGPGNMAGVSNADREDLLAALKEYIAAAEGRSHLGPSKPQ
jgi:hypothetical protein